MIRAKELRLDGRFTEPSVTFCPQVVCLGRPAVDYTVLAEHEDYGLKAGEHKFVDRQWLQQEIVKRQAPAVAGGSMGNTAWVLGSLGIPTAYIGLVGDDAAGALFIQSMQTVGVTMPAPVTGHTKTLLVIINKRGERAFLGSQDDVLLKASDIVRYFEAYVSDAKLALTENYSFKLQPEAALTFMKLAKNRDMELIMTLPNQYILQDYVSILSEAEMLADIIYGNRHEIELWQNLHGKHLGKAYLQTRDVDGAVWDGPDDTWHVPSNPIHSIADANGAGDSFLAGFVAARTKGLSVERAMHVGHQVAAITIQHLGPRPPGLTPDLIKN